MKQRDRQTDKHRDRQTARHRNTMQCSNAAIQKYHKQSAFTIKLNTEIYIQIYTQLQRRTQAYSYLMAHQHIKP